jgi:hypothetical protein
VPDLETEPEQSNKRPRHDPARLQKTTSPSARPNFKIEKKPKRKAEFDPILENENIDKKHRKTTKGNLAVFTGAGEGAHEIV